MSRVPRYREDTKGNLRALLDECTATMAGEIRNADFFVVEFADLTNSVREYEELLTDTELARCFKNATTRAAA